jgi:hypothetical protein
MRWCMWVSTEAENKELTFSLNIVALRAQLGGQCKIVIVIRKMYVAGKIP